MALKIQRSALLLAVVALSGCEWLGTQQFAAPAGGGGPGVTQTGTQTVQQRVQQLRADQTALAAGIGAQQAALNSVRGQVAADARNYNGLVGQITSRLQAGTTPGNPDLVRQWNEAQSRLDTVTVGVGQLNSLASQVTTQASVAGYLLDTIRSTYAVGGAVDDDHRQLRGIENDTNRSIQVIDRLIGDLNGEIARQNGFLAGERSHLAALSYGVNIGRLGNPGGTRATTTTRRGAALPATGAPTQLGDARPNTR